LQLELELGFDRRTEEPEHRRTGVPEEQRTGCPVETSCQEKLAHCKCSCHNFAFPPPELPSNLSDLPTACCDFCQSCVFGSFVFLAGGVGGREPAYCRVTGQQDHYSLVDSFVGANVPVPYPQVLQLPMQRENFNNSLQL